MDKAMYTVEETAEMLGIGRSMAYRMVQQRKLPSVKLGSRRGTRIPAQALKRWLEARTKEAESGQG